VNQLPSTLIGFTLLVGGLAGVLVFAALRLIDAARRAHRMTADSDRSILITDAIQDAVTKLKAQERATQARADASDRLSSEIISNLTAGLLVVGNTGEIRILNPAGRRMLGVGDTTVGGSYRDLLGEGSALGASIDECLRSGRPIIRRRVTLPDARGVSGPTSLGVSVSPMLSAEQELQGAICLFTDLTTVTALEEQLRLRESLAALGELTAGLAHEFRNGLSTIHGYGRLLDPDRVPEPYRSYVEGIRQETEALGEIVTSFVNFARPTELTLATVGLAAVSERAADEIRGDVEARGGALTVRGEFGDVPGDEVLLRQAFSNLCRNALEACTEHGVAPAIVIEGSVDRIQRLARVSVTDNGPGVDPAAGDRIFRPFFTTKRTGTGLGLALVQKIVVSHNGRVIVRPGAEGGARFEVALPIPPRPLAPIPDV
jgi:signal transduction histidine kinase